jgi:PEP-CTERM/exosortase A-associated glycosyltransferase
MKSKHQRILHVLNYSLPYISGYCSRSHAILKAQIQAGIEAAAVTSPRHQELVPESAGAEEIDGVRYVRVSSPKPLPGRNASLLRQRRFMQALESGLEDVASAFRPTVIHAHSPSLCGIPARKVAARLGIPFVYEVRALWEDAAVDQKAMSRWSWKYRLSRYVETRLLRRSQAIVVLCDALKEEIAGRTGAGHHIIVVPNGVDHNLFQPRHKNTELARSIGVQDSIVIGFIGTFFRFEGLDDLVKAWESIGEAAPNARLVMVGYGEMAEELERLRARSRHPESIIMTGRVPHKEVLDYYSIMDIMVYPRKSIRLTELVTPLKPLEAMAMGKAVVASDVGGLRDIVAGGNAGMLFRAGDDRELAAAIVALIRDGARREAYGTRARGYILEERTWSALVERYAQLYHDVT